MTDKSDRIRLLELKSMIRTLIREWEDNCDSMRSRNKKIYVYCARELEKTLTEFERKEPHLVYIQVD